MEDIFIFQNKIKLFLKHLGLNEVINYSMVSKGQITEFGFDPKKHLRLSNSISEDIEYLRISLLPSLFKNIKDNTGKKEVLRFFEVAKVYLPKEGDLPDEVYKIGIATNTDYFDLKGIIEALYRELNIHELSQPEIIEKSGVFLTEIDFKTLIDSFRLVPIYKPIHPYAVIKLDKTFEIGPDHTFETISKSARKSKLLQKIEVITIFKNRLTLRFYFSSPVKNITEEEVKKDLDLVG